MPSSKTQWNVRPDAVTEQLIKELLPLATERTGLEVSQADLLRLMAFALAREYEHPVPKPPPVRPKGK
jgi:nucleoside diphosphate kinase